MGRANECAYTPIAPGNIAKVLRHARASLKDPSRPFTPTERECLRSTKSLFGDAACWVNRTSTDDPARSERTLARESFDSVHAVSIRRATKGRTSLRRRHHEVAFKSTSKWEDSIVLGARDQGRSRHAAAQNSGGIVGLRLSAAGAWDSDPCTPISSTGRKCIPSSHTHGGTSLVTSAIGGGHVSGCTTKAEKQPRMLRDSRSSGGNLQSSVMRPSAEENDQRPRGGKAKKPDGDYGGLYFSDDDLDTSEWDIDSGVVIDTPPHNSGTQLTLVKREFGKTEGSRLSDILEAIKIETRKTGCGRVRATNFEISSRADPDGRRQGRDESPDPGISESERERNIKLSELLHLLSSLLDPTIREVSKENVSVNGYRHEAEVVSDQCYSRVVDVLLEVMQRPRRAVDASPPRIAEMPGLIAASITLRLILPSIWPGCVGNDPVGYGDHRNVTGGNIKTFSLLEKVCRFVFDASSRSGADEAFFASGVAKGLLTFINQATPRFTETSSKLQENGRAKYSDTSDGAVVIRGCSQDGKSEGPTHASVCDALTFTLGCLKNISATRCLQERLVRGGAVWSLCELIRSTRDAYRRLDRICDVKSLSPSGGDVAHVKTNMTTWMPTSKPTTAYCNSDSAGTDGARRTSSITTSWRNHVIPLLAQSTALLRDLAAAKVNHENFRTAGAVGVLCSILPLYRHHPEVVLNAARTIAKLSLQENMRREMNADPGHVRQLLGALVEQGCDLDKSWGGLENTGEVLVDSATVEAQCRQWDSNEKRIAACVRLAFALGNLTSSCDDNRQLIGCSLGGVESLPALLQSSARAHLAAWDCLMWADNSDTRVSDDPAGTLDWSSRRRETDMVFQESRRQKIWRACDGLEEMLVKITRLLANISINRDVGQRVCRHSGLTTVEPLLAKCLDVFALVEDGILLPYGKQRLQSARYRSDWNRGRVETEHAEQFTPGEELLLNIVSLVTNLSFYGPEPGNLTAASTDGVDEVSVRAGYQHSKNGGNSAPAVCAAESSAPPSNILFTLARKARRDITGTRTERPRGEQDVLCGHLVKVLLYPNVEAVAEAARAFGNFSRDHDCRQAMARRRADEVLVVLLSHAHRETVFAAAGALVNVMISASTKALLCRESVGAGEKLARLVRQAGLTDPGMAEVACQALHNLLIEPLPPGGVEQVLGGAANRSQLYWTLQELTEAALSCYDSLNSHRVDDEALSSMGQEANQRGGVVRGFAAAAAAVLKAV
ncbi:unnamed protein product, partial [Sphacelaria rigidula]